MAFPQRLSALRKHQNLTQHALADLVGVHLTQIQRYESGTTQPTLEVIRKLALALAVSGDALIFDPEERGPDDELKLQFEAVRQLPPEDRQAIKAMPVRITGNATINFGLMVSPTNHAPSSRAITGLT